MNIIKDLLFSLRNGDGKTQGETMMISGCWCLQTEITQCKKMSKSKSLVISNLKAICQTHDNKHLSFFSCCLQFVSSCVSPSPFLKLKTRSFIYSFYLLFYKHKTRVRLDVSLGWDQTRCLPTMCAAGSN